MTTDAQVGALYDRLLRYERSTTAPVAVHKRLRFPAAWQARGVFDLNDWLAEVLGEVSAETQLLDAGCGTGATLFSLLKKQGHGLGLTLSQQQVTQAQDWAQQQNIDHRVQFAHQSYDAPIPQKFDKIVTIEALGHSADVAATVSNLAASLAPTGQMIIVEDALSIIDYTNYHNLLRRKWHYTHIYTQKAYRDAFAAAGLSITMTVDFTPFVSAKRYPFGLLRALEKSSQLLSTERRAVADIFLGGLALETLYAQASMRYTGWILARTP